MAADALLARGRRAGRALAADTHRRSPRPCRASAAVSRTRSTCSVTRRPSVSGRPSQRAARRRSGADAVLAILTPQAMTDPTGAAAAVVGARQGQPQAAARRMAGRAIGRARPAHAREARRRRPTRFPSRRSSRSCTSSPYARNLETLHETPRTLPVTFALDRARVKELHRRPSSPRAATVLSEASVQVAARRLRDTGHQTAAGRQRRRRGRGRRRASATPWCSRSARRTSAQDRRRRRGHRDRNARRGARGLRADRRLGRRAPARRPHLRGVTVQPMVTAPGYELLLGARKDPSFGAVILVGAGRRGRRGARRPRARPAAPERAPGPAHARVAPDLAACCAGIADGRPWTSTRCSRS